MPLLEIRPLVALHRLLKHKLSPYSYGVHVISFCAGCIASDINAGKIGLIVLSVYLILQIGYDF